MRESDLDATKVNVPHSKVYCDRQTNRSKVLCVVVSLNVLEKEAHYDDIETIVKMIVKAL